MDDEEVSNSSSVILVESESEDSANDSYDHNSDSAPVSDDVDSTASTRPATPHTVATNSEMVDYLSAADTTLAGAQDGALPSTSVNLQNPLNVAPISQRHTASTGGYQAHTVQFNANANIQILTEDDAQLHTGPSTSILITSPPPSSSSRTVPFTPSSSRPYPTANTPSPLPSVTILNRSVTEFKSPPRKRLRENSAKSSPPRAACNTVADDDDGQCCPICFEDWSNSGTHRLASLSCGHLFGLSCIERWLKSQKQNGQCPQCNNKARKKDIRVIFAKNLKVIDTTERDAALKELEAQKTKTRQAEMEAANARMRCQVATDECSRLRQEIDRLNQQLAHYRSQAGTNNSIPGNHGNAAGSMSVGPSSQQQSTANYSFDMVIKICDRGNCRVMAYSPECATLVVSQESINPLFPGYGVKKINVLDFKTSQYVSLQHSKMIRDVTFNSEGLLLTASMDKTVRVTSVTSNSVVQMYNCQFPVWSCCWSKDDRNYFFAGLGNGRVGLYDIRNTATHVSLLNTEGSMSPAASLQYIKTDPHAPFRAGGLIISQLACSNFYENKQDDFRLHALPIEGNLLYMSLEETTRHILASYRPSARYNKVRHEMYELSCRNISADPTVIQNSCTCHSVQMFLAGSACKSMSRSRLILSPAGNGKLLACAGDEASQSLHIWDAQSGTLTQKITCNSEVLDICPININDTSYLAALTDKTVRLHKWTQ